MALDGFVYLAETSGAAANFSFTSIPSGYVDLVMRGSVQSATGAFTQTADMRCNGDTGSNYDQFFFGTNGSTTTTYSSETAAQASGTLGVCGGSYLGTWTAEWETYISGYDDSSSYTTWVTRCGMGGGASGYNVNAFAGGIWRNTATVTSLTSVNLNQDADTRILLFGRRI